MSGTTPADKVWLIDGNRLKEKAVPLLFPTEMESCGHLPGPVPAVTVSEIENMLYLEGLELTHCKNCEYWEGSDSVPCGKCKHWSTDAIPDIIRSITHMTRADDFCSEGQRRLTDGSDIRG